MDTIEVRNPATGKPVGSVQRASAREVAELAGRARKAQIAWARASFSDRSRVVARFHDLILERSDQIFDTIQAETGKARRDALAELVTTAGTARYYLSHGARPLASRRKRAAIPIVTGSTLEYRPHGLVGLIIPWNYPFLLSMADAIPALLAGNALILKPSDLTPLSAVLGKNLLTEAGLDPDLLAIANGGADVGGYLIGNVDYVGFTGSSATGRKVAVAAAERLIPFSLEMGGKNPMIVLKDAPLESAAQALAVGAFSNSGQTCISIERVYVESPVFDRFAELIASEAKKLKLGWSASWDLDMGSLIHSEHAGKVRDMVDGAVRAGAIVLAGGRQRDDLGPCFFEPTVLSNVDANDAIAKSETFGPVISLHPVASRDEAIALSNDSDYGLNASIWAGNTASGVAVARQIQTGSVAINSTLMIYNAFDVPMGGIKQSGIGRRHGEDGIVRYTQTQSIVSSFSAGGGYDSLFAKIRSQKRASGLISLVRWWKRIPGLR